MRVVEVGHLIDLVQVHGLEKVLASLCTYIEHDFERWQSFDKSPRYASHSRDGVIELMPTADEQHFAFKYVTGYPSNLRSGLRPSWDLDS